MSQAHIAVACASLAITTALVIAWTRMKYPQTTPTGVASAAIIAAICSAVFGIATVLDGLGFAFVRSPVVLSWAVIVVVAGVAARVLSRSAKLIGRASPRRVPIR